eukprot:CAMPEP_0180145016 /NCGR_PEP_ID=MMETSP0986-20121125/17385_1 /TAXON_ID=697907 /ORGANISM="non described non described, Strain CCMP2293" /LENGTH=89 /DNA_ID=CAMNT_0022089245 /DNA_START=27 /DNA_END=296 /DNA_ORIENTATION=-
MADSSADLPPLGLMDLLPLVGMVVGIVVVLLYGLGCLGGSSEAVPAEDGKPQRRNPKAGSGSTGKMRHPEDFDDESDEDEDDDEDAKDK